MEQVTVAHAKEHLDELVQRAARGEDVRISDPKLGTVRLLPVDKAPHPLSPEALGYDIHREPRVLDTMPPFVPLKEKRKLGTLVGIVPPPPDDFFDPLTEDELKDWYGDDDL